MVSRYHNVWRHEKFLWCTVIVKAVSPYSVFFLSVLFCFLHWKLLVSVVKTCDCISLKSFIVARMLWMPSWHRGDGWRNHQLMLAAVLLPVVSLPPVPQVKYLNLFQETNLWSLKYSQSCGLMHMSFHANLSFYNSPLKTNTLHGMLWCSVWYNSPVLCLSLLLFRFWDMFYGKMLPGPCQTPNLKDHVCVFITPGDRVAQMYP
jgi:hypothetical protein